MLTDKEILELESLYRMRDAESSRVSLPAYGAFVMKEFQNDWFHTQYYELLQMFADGKIKKLMVSVAPQHGKSTGSSQHLPSFIFGQQPNKQIAIGSYAASLAFKFGRYVKNIVRSDEYKEVFPDTKMPERGDTSGYINRADETEILNARGSLKLVGVSGPLTGNPVDIMIMDDLYKDYKEACSPIIRENVWDWYTSVVRTRLHNKSQQLIVFTRWHEDDLVGRLEKKEKVVMFDENTDINNIPDDVWLKINFEAIKTGPPNQIDPREPGEALWPERHNKKKLLEDKATDPVKFEALYQGNPASTAGRLYGRFNTYLKPPEFKQIKNYTDTADKGDDYLCSIVYGVGLDDDKLYILDILYTQEGMEKTEGWTASMLDTHKVNHADIESNNGGRSFARVVDEKTDSSVYVDWFHQSQNKESRIISQSAQVMREVVFPDDWSSRWPDFYTHITGFLRNFKANKHDDAPDTLTGCVEMKESDQYNW